MTWDVRGSGPEKEKVKGREDSNTWPSLFPSLLAVREPLTLPKIENPSPEMVDKYHTLYTDALHKLVDQHKIYYGHSEPQKLLFQ